MTRQTIPVIDIAGLRSKDSDKVRAIADEIRDACTSIGFFYVVGHGVPQDVIDKAFAMSQAFFALGLDERREAKVNHVYHGFTEMKVDELWGTRNIAPFETFAIGTELSNEELDALPPGSFLGANVWPSRPVDFRANVLNYFHAVTASASDVLRAMAISLDIDADFFASRFSRPASVSTMLHYPPLPADATEDWVSSTPHTDADCITFLAQDDNGGLQVQPRGINAWIDVPPLKSSFVVNIGDLMARWTNDRFTSTMHRVVNRSGRERYSIATFNNPNPEAIVDPRQTGISPSQCRYEPISAGDYMGEYMRQIYAAREAALQTRPAA